MSQGKRSAGEEPAIAALPCGVESLWRFSAAGRSRQQKAPRDRRRLAHGTCQTFTEGRGTTIEQAVPEMFEKDAVLVVESDSNVSRNNPDQAEFCFTSAMIQRLVPVAEPGKRLDKATFLSGWLDKDASMVAMNKEAVIAFRPSAALTHGGLR